MAAALCAAATLVVAPPPAYADAVRDKQWHLRFLKVAEAQKYSQGEGVTVALIDTGVDPNHPDLRGTVLPGIDYLDRGGNGQHDADGHGTAMAGLIAAHGHGRDSGVLGIAPKAKILPIRSIARDQRDTVPAAPVEAIDYAVDHGAKVLNLSFSVDASQDMDEAIQRARAADVVLVAGAGNTGDDILVPYPGGAEGVLTVGAINRSGSLDSISLTGDEVDIVAPGADITSTAPGRKYRTGTGTSDSTAIVAGAVALVRAKYPDLSADEVVHRLTATATDKGPPGRDDQYGYGVLNLVAALTADVPVAGQANATASAPPSDSPRTTAAAEPAPVPRSNSTALIVVLVVAIALVAAGILAWFYLRRRRHAG